MFLSVEVSRSHDNLYYASCPELSVISRGNTQDEAIANLKSDIAIQMAKDSVMFNDVKFISEEKFDNPTKH